MSFVDDSGFVHASPTMLGRWLMSPTNPASTGTLTINFTPAIPAHRIALGIIDLGNGSTSMTANPVATLGLAGGASPADFVAHATAGTPMASYDPATGQARMRSPLSTYGTRQSIVLRGNSNAMVSSLSLSITCLFNGDLVAFHLMSVPSCVRVEKQTLRGTGAFDFASTALVDWNAAAHAPISLATSAAATPVRSGRVYYAAPIGSNGQGTVPVTLAETGLGADWQLQSASCTDLNGSLNGNGDDSFGTLSGTTLTLPTERMRFESDIVCRFTNALDRAELSVTKTNTPAAGANDQADDALVNGAQTRYRLVFRNDGPASAEGAVLRDQPVSGLTCTNVQCVQADGGATCPGGDLSGLLGTGLQVEPFPAGASLAFDVDCQAD